MKATHQCHAADPFDYAPVDEILERYQGQKGATIPVLQAIQEVYGYLPRQAMEYAAKQLRIPFSRIYGVATFYAQFHLTPRGENIIRVCQGTYVTFAVYGHGCTQRAVRIEARKSG